MTTPEGKIEKHLKKEVEASGGKVRKLKWIGKSGAPDRLVWWPGTKFDPLGGPRSALVELKAPGKKPTKVQEIEHDALRADGWTVLVVDSIQAADAAIKMVRDRIRNAPKPLDPVTTIDKPSREPKYDLRSPELSHIIQDNSDLA